MALVESSFTHSNGFVSAVADQLNVWKYKTATNTLAETVAADYFLPLTGRMQVGDILLVEASDDHGMYRFDAVTSATVTVAAY